MNGIGKEEVGLAGIIAFCALVGFAFNSCNKADVAEQEIALHEHELVVKGPCRSSSILMTAYDNHVPVNESCAPGAIISSQFLGNEVGGEHRPQFQVICSCPNKELPKE